MNPSGYANLRDVPLAAPASNLSLLRVSGAQQGKKENTVTGGFGGYTFTRAQGAMDARVGGRSVTAAGTGVRDPPPVEEPRLPPNAAFGQGVAGGVRQDAGRRPAQSMGDVPRDAEQYEEPVMLTPDLMREQGFSASSGEPVQIGHPSNQRNVIVNFHKLVSLRDLEKAGGRIQIGSGQLKGVSDPETLKYRVNNPKAAAVSYARIDNLSAAFIGTQPNKGSDPAITNAPPIGVTFSLVPASAANTVVVSDAGNVRVHAITPTDGSRTSKVLPVDQSVLYNDDVILTGGARATNIKNDVQDPDSMMPRFSGAHAAAGVNDSYWAMRYPSPVAEWVVRHNHELDAQDRVTSENLFVLRDQTTPTVMFVPANVVRKAEAAFKTIDEVMYKELVNPTMLTLGVVRADGKPMSAPDDITQRLVDGGDGRRSSSFQNGSLLISGTLSVGLAYPGRQYGAPGGAPAPQPQPQPRTQEAQVPSERDADASSVASRGTRSLYAELTDV